MCLKVNGLAMPGEASVISWFNYDINAKPQIKVYCLEYILFAK